ncbi:unnamed protein product, partial [marine sediment metagenome]
AFSDHNNQPRLITIQPWDKEVLAEIEKAIRDQSDKPSKQPKINF